MKDIMVVDDEVYICNIILEALGEFNDFNVRKFSDPVKALEHLDKSTVDLVLTDLVMGNHSGVEILEKALANHPDCIVVLMTGYPTVKTAISVLKKGGYDYLIKPFKLEDLTSTIRRGLDHQQLKRENVALKSQAELRKISEAMARGIGFNQILNMINETLLQQLPATASSILLFDKKQKRNRVKCIAGEYDDPKINEFLNGRKLDQAVAERGDGVFCENIEIEKDEKPYRRSIVSYPLISKRVLLGHLNVVYDDRFKHITPGQMHMISLLASQAASAMESSRLIHNLKRSYVQTIGALANAIEARDNYTAGHTDRVYYLAEILARKLGWNRRRMNQLKTGCRLHDIGKIGIPDSILNKPGRLDDEERLIMQQHPTRGAAILGQVPYLRPVIPYILCHHERFDGNGYPNGLKGKEIPIEGRLLAVVDTFDAITSDRPYRQGKTHEFALKELREHSGTQFDPDLVKLFHEAYEEGLINEAVRHADDTVKMVIPPVTA